jgi:hypothetical protein
LSDTLSDHSDPTTAHCRYTMVIDPTDSEAAVDLLFALKLLDQNNTNVVALSDFPEDATPTKRTAVLAQIKKSIENGDCLLLMNSAPLHSALYDVINRHYAISVEQDGITGEVRKVAFAQISLGSFSRYVRVHPNFRLIVHVPESKLCFTPMPFLNRMEKYYLSVRDALAQRIMDVSQNPPSCLRSVATPELRKALFEALIRGVEHFVDFVGGNSSFYGMSRKETVPTLVLRALESACNDPEQGTVFEPRMSVLSSMLRKNKFYFFKSIFKIYIKMLNLPNYLAPLCNYLSTNPNFPLSFFCGIFLNKGANSINSLSSKYFKSSSHSTANFFKRGFTPSGTPPSDNCSQAPQSQRCPLSCNS